MDPDRHLPNPIRNPPRNQPQLMSSPDAQPRAAPPTASQYQQPSLPSIRQLHPYLPPSGMPQPHGPASGLPAYPYPSSSPYAGPSSSDPHFAPPAPSAAYHRSEPLESEGEAETEHQGPPKKKRRRQALSCNECKRRKIKCDRAQPCGPCARRGDQSKCQWRTLEPVDKYVPRQEYEAFREQSRADYDQLKRKLDHLESVVARLFSAPSSGAVGVPLYPIPQEIPGPTSEGLSSYHAGSSSQVLYPSSVQSSVPYHPESMARPHYYPTTSPHMIPEGTPQASTSAPQVPPGSSGPSHIRKPSDGKSPTQARQSPLALSSITSPYNPDIQSKNWHAQTLMALGERLRPARGGWKGPVVLLCGTRQQRSRIHQRQWRARRMFPWKVSRLLPRDFTCPVPRLEGDTGIPPVPIRL